MTFRQVIPECFTVNGLLRVFQAFHLFRVKFSHLRHHTSARLPARQVPYIKSRFSGPDSPAILTRQIHGRVEKEKEDAHQQIDRLYDVFVRNWSLLTRRGESTCKAGAIF